jgi:hypothetical protein
LEKRINWFRVAIGATIGVAIVLTMFRYRYETAGSHIYRIDALTGRYCEYPCATTAAQPVVQNPSATPTRFNVEAYMAKQPVRDQLVYAQAKRLRAFQATLPIGESSFFGGMRTSLLRLDCIITGAFESSDGVLYVVYAHCQTIGPGCERYHFGFIDHATVNEIWLPHGSEPWMGMDLLSSSAGETAVVQAATDQGTTQYAVNTEKIVRTRPSSDLSGVDVSPPRVLSTGEGCVVDTSRAPTLVWAVGRGSKRAFISTQEFLRATNGILDVSDAGEGWCTHFHDVDLFVIGTDKESPSTFVIDHGTMEFAAPATPEMATANHMLLMRIEASPDGGITGWDYLNVQPRAVGAATVKR